MGLALPRGGSRPGRSPLRCLAGSPKGGSLGVLQPRDGSETGPPPVLEAGVCVEALLPSRPGLVPPPAAVAPVLACVFTWPPCVANLSCLPPEAAGRALRADQLIRDNLLVQGLYVGHIC